MIPIPGGPVHVISLLPGDVIHRESHFIQGTDYEGHAWKRIVLCDPADVHVERVRREGPDLAAVYWWLGSVTGVTVYGPTSLVPLLRRAA
jgi:hypothetical protein